MKPFSKKEIISLTIIFAILIVISVPNFIISFRRARDQVRRDDLGSLVHALGEYDTDLGYYPAASKDNLIMNCLKPGDKPVKNSKGLWVVDTIPCQWGKDALTNIIEGNVYLSILPRDPDYQKGATYLYFSDGKRYQIYAAMEGMDEAEIDPKIIARNLKCGNRTCNVGRAYNVPPDISIDEYDKILLPNAQK